MLENHCVRGDSGVKWQENAVASLETIDGTARPVRRSTQMDTTTTKTEPDFDAMTDDQLAAWLDTNAESWGLTFSQTSKRWSVAYRDSRGDIGRASAPARSIRIGLLEACDAVVRYGRA